MKNKRMNAIPESYRAYYIEPGLADYTAEGIGVVLVQKPALDAMMSTYVGKPVVNLEHTDLEPEELFNMSVDKVKDFADGVIAASGYDAEKGWYWTDMMIWDEETLENIKNGFSVSCAYDVTDADENGGTYHNVPYDEEVISGEALHMAIVLNPRYEKAWIIKNSKSEEDNLKIVFKKKEKKTPVKKTKVQNAEPEEKDEEVELENGYVENEAGEQVPIEELANMYKEKMAKKNMGKAYNMDDEVTVDGNKMTVGELIAAIEEDDEVVENAEPAQDDDAEEVVDESLQNSAPSKKVKNANFKKVKNAAGKGNEEFKPRNLNTISERLHRGKSRYGKTVAQGGK